MRSLTIGTGAVGAAVIASVVLGTGVASAFPNVTGGLFSDAKASLSKQGYSVVVAGRVGDQVEDDDCVVSNAQPAAFRDSNGESQGDIALVYLNCYANVASNRGPGYSAGSPIGRAALAQQKAAEEQAANQERQELEAVDAPQG